MEKEPEGKGGRGRAVSLWLPSPRGGCWSPRLEAAGEAGRNRDLGRNTNRAHDRLDITLEGEEGVSEGPQVSGLSIQVDGDAF